MANISLRSDTKDLGLRHNSPRYVHNSTCCTLHLLAANLHCSSPREAYCMIRTSAYPSFSSHRPNNYNLFLRCTQWNGGLVTLKCLINCWRVVTRQRVHRRCRYLQFYRWEFQTYNLFLQRRRHGRRRIDFSAFVM